MLVDNAGRNKCKIPGRCAWGDTKHLQNLCSRCHSRSSGLFFDEVSLVSLSKLLICFPDMSKSSVLVQLRDVTLGKGGIVGVKPTESPSTWDTSCCQRRWEMSLNEDCFISRAYRSKLRLEQIFLALLYYLFLSTLNLTHMLTASNLLRRAKRYASHLFYSASKMLRILSCISRRRSFLPCHNHLPSHTTRVRKGGKAVTSLQSLNLW